MKINRILVLGIAAVGLGLFITSCQKLDRPQLKELILDPPPPPYSPLKSFWSFDGTIRDTGQFRQETTSKNTTFVTGINGQAVQIGADGYVLISSLNDSLKTPGSFSLAFWMNGVGPVQGGAQGLFAISNKTQFWGNLELFLENLDNGAEAYLKIHMLNGRAADGIGEQWNEVKIPNALNKWTHIAVTYDASNSQLSVYADGAPTTLYQKVLDGGNYGAVTYKDVNGMVLGSFAFQTDPSLTNHGPEGWAKSFNGALDQFRFYNVPLTASQVNELFTSKN